MPVSALGIIGGSIIRKSRFIVAVVVAAFSFGASLPATAQNIEQSNSYISVRRDGNKLQSLRFDAKGAGQYGSETIAATGSIAGFETVYLKGDTLVFAGPAGEFVWDLPFEHAGYYDADSHLNYPSPINSDGATLLALPFRRFVTSAGQYVNIEFFKRLPTGRRMYTLNIADGSQLLLIGDDQLGCDLKLTCPAQDSIYCEVGEYHLYLKARMTDQPITIQVLPRGTESVPGSRTTHPWVRFEPDYQITYEITGKSISASELMTDLMRFGIYWHPSMIAFGDWGLGAVETHILDDPRSWYLKHLRAELLKMIALIGYDRFEHFGMMFAGTYYPDYGAGGLLNLPPTNALYDMRMLHLNGQWIETISQYVLATGDKTLLRSRRARWLATDGEQPQPICGKNATCADYILAAGDCRLDGRTPEKVHTLSQSFNASAPFNKITLRLGSNRHNEPAHGWMELRQEDSDDTIIRQPFTINPRSEKIVDFTLPQAMSAGMYTVTIGNDDSGKRYFGPDIYWLTDPESNEPVPPAGSGPFAGTLYDRLVLLFDYILENTGADKEHLFSYINDPQFNIADHKSGRPRVCTENSYWEAAGGGYDAFEGLWYNAACRAMAEMAALMNDETSAGRYHHLAIEADRAYNAKYWHTANEKGQAFSRYHACEDWDGQTHDYGFTYYNLEAACRGISSNDQARAILWWLDHGQWSTDGGTTWNDNIYDIWGFAPPFNTIANYTWINVTGTLPYLEVLTNGGTRPNIAGRDVLVRARHLGIDNMHERSNRILARYASPDRLTGGRTVDDLGGRGRWHFGPPHVDRADVEGFREIFPQNGDMVTHQIMAYLGMDYSAQGLSLRPRVPSDLNRITFGGIGYAGALFNFDVQAVREDVTTNTIRTDDPYLFEFQTEKNFNKVGLRISIQPFNVHLNQQLVLILERKRNGRWQQIDKTWYNHVRDGQWVWCSVEQWLSPGAYRIQISDLKTSADQVMKPADMKGYSGVRCVAERTRLVINIEERSAHPIFQLQGSSIVTATSSRMETVLDPGKRSLLTRN